MEVQFHPEHNSNKVLVYVGQGETPKIHLTPVFSYTEHDTPSNSAVSGWQPYTDCTVEVETNNMFD